MLSAFYRTLTTLAARRQVTNCKGQIGMCLGAAQTTTNFAPNQEPLEVRGARGLGRVGQGAAKAPTHVTESPEGS
jgi:hypothetical protein